MVGVGPPSGRLERPYPKYRALNYFSGVKGVEQILPQERIVGIFPKRS